MLRLGQFQARDAAMLGLGQIPRQERGYTKARTSMTQGEGLGARATMGGRLGLSYGLGLGWGEDLSNYA